MHRFQLIFSPCYYRKTPCPRPDPSMMKSPSLSESPLPFPCSWDRDWTLSSMMMISGGSGDVEDILNREGKEFKVPEEEIKENRERISDVLGKAALQRQTAADSQPNLRSVSVATFFLLASIDTRKFHETSDETSKGVARNPFTADVTQPYQEELSLVALYDDGRTDDLPPNQLPNLEK